MMQSDTLRGVFWMVVAMAGFAVEDVGIKAASATLPTSQLLILLGLGGTAVFAMWTKWSGHPLYTPDIIHPAVLARNTAELLGTVCFVSAITLLPLATASAILQATPLVVTLAAALFLGAQVGWRRWTAIGIGFLGVLLIVRPGWSAFDPASLLAVAATVLLAIRDLTTRLAPKNIPSPLLAMYGFASAGLAGVVMFPFASEFQRPDAAATQSLIIALGAGVIAYYAITVAMRAGDIAVVTPFRYTRLLFAIILGFVVFGDLPDLWTWVGAALILGSGLYTLWRERQHAPPRPLSSKGKPG